MAYVVAVVLGYLFGCSNMAYYIGTIKKVKIKEIGSKNYGASNTLAMIGFWAGFFVLVHDILKALFASIIVSLLFPDAQCAGAVAGASAVLGHIFPFYLKFDGGKGFASYMGMLLAVNPIFALCIMAIALTASLIIDYVIVGTFTIICSAPIYFFIKQDFITGLIFLFISIIVALKHKANIQNVLQKNGKEMRIQAAFKKKYRNSDNKKQ